VVLATWNNGSPKPAFNNAAQAWNHEFYWESMSPKSVGASGLHDWILLTQQCELQRKLRLPSGCSAWRDVRSGQRRRFCSASSSTCEQQSMCTRRQLGAASLFDADELPPMPDADVLTPSSRHDAELKGDLKADIESTFGSVEAFNKEFSTAGATQFGSGWAWLVVEGGKLVMHQKNKCKKLFLNASSLRRPLSGIGNQLAK